MPLFLFLSVGYSSFPQTTHNFSPDIHLFDNFFKPTSNHRQDTSSFCEHVFELVHMYLVQQAVC